MYVMYRYMYLNRHPVHTYLFKQVPGTWTQHAGVLVPSIQLQKK